MFVIGMPHFSHLFIFNKLPAKYAFYMCAEYDETKQARYDTTNTYDRNYIRTHVYLFLF